MKSVTTAKVEITRDLTTGCFSVWFFDHLVVYQVSEIIALATAMKWLSKTITE